MLQQLRRTRKGVMHVATIMTHTKGVINVATVWDTRNSAMHFAQSYEAPGKGVMHVATVRTHQERCNACCKSYDGLGNI